ncbi:MAG: internalization-like protein competence protein ComEC/Rec2, competence protein ComEC protein [Parcubacteria group bacterium]|nr:internalization-like protein competence protein ComEC/Rec2, competence protein ComEC protein [Parcubacteria group bacterium]
MVSVIFVWNAGYQKRSTNLLHVYFLDVGQGDAIFIDSPTHGRILIDGGPNRRVVTELGKILPFGDRRIDVVIETHPDSDHISGLVDVIREYSVGAFIEPGVESTNKIDNLLRDEVKNKNIPDILARRGQVINLGGGAKLFILFPNQDVSTWETNEASVVAKLVYGDTSFLLTGDSPKKAEYILLEDHPEILKSSVLKAGHHGSATSDSVPYVEAVDPKYAVISAGKGNSYGLPKQITLDNLAAVGATIFATEDTGGLQGLGTIEFVTDGKVLQRK